MSRLMSWVMGLIAATVLGVIGASDMAERQADEAAKVETIKAAREEAKRRQMWRRRQDEAQRMTGFPASAGMDEGSKKK